MWADKTVSEQKQNRANEGVFTHDMQMRRERAKREANCIEGLSESAIGEEEAHIR